MNQGSGYYVISGEAALGVILELGQLRDMSSYFIKFHVEDKSTSEWEASPIPDLMELYSGARACMTLLREMMEQEPPPEYKEKLTGGGTCVTGEQYQMFSSMYTFLKGLKLQISSLYNLSFEVH